MIGRIYVADPRHLNLLNTKYISCELHVSEQIFFINLVFRFVVHDIPTLNKYWFLENHPAIPVYCITNTVCCCRIVENDLEFLQSFHRQACRTWPEIRIQKAKQIAIQLNLS